MPMRFSSGLVNNVVLANNKDGVPRVSGMFGARARVSGMHVTGFIARAIGSGSPGVAGRANVVGAMLKLLTGNSVGYTNDRFGGSLFSGLSGHPAAKANSRTRGTPHGPGRAMNANIMLATTRGRGTRRRTHHGERRRRRRTELLTRGRTRRRTGHEGRGDLIRGFVEKFGGFIGSAVSRRRWCGRVLR